MDTKVVRLYGEKDVRIEQDSVGVPASGEVLVRVIRGGICGSDLHYYLHGGFGTVRVQEPVIMGHEFAGYIESVGPDVQNLKPGDRVGINPSQPCGKCTYCKQGIYQQCLDMHFIGSAFRLPHEQGGFRERIIVPAIQCAKGGEDTDFTALACAEPLAVCLHAAGQVDGVQGKKVLVNGVGPIGALSVAVAKYSKASEIVVLDLSDKTVQVASELGADKGINLSDPDAALSLEQYEADKGYFDLVFECSAAQAAMPNVFSMIRPQGTIIQVGVAGEIIAPLGMLVGKEIRWIGTHRFHEEYHQAVKLISSGAIDVLPMVTDVFPMRDIQKAIEAATDRSHSVKVQLDFS